MFKRAFSLYTYVHASHTNMQRQEVLYSNNCHYNFIGKNQGPLPLFDSPQIWSKLKVIVISHSGVERVWRGSPAWINPFGAALNHDRNG